MKAYSGEDLIAEVYKGFVSGYKHKRIVFKSCVTATIEKSIGYDSGPPDIADYLEANLIEVDKRNWVISIGRGYNSWMLKDSKCRVDILALEFEKEPSEDKIVKAIESNNSDYEHSLFVSSHGKLTTPPGRFSKSLEKQLSTHFFIDSMSSPTAMLPKTRGVDLYEGRFVEILVSAVEETLTNAPPQYCFSGKNIEK